MSTPSQPPAPTPAPPAPAPAAAPAAAAAQLVASGEQASVAVLTNGDQVVAWKDASRVCWRRYARQALAASDALCLPLSNTVFPATVAALGTGFVLAWLEADTAAFNSPYSLKTQAFTADGALNGTLRSVRAPQAGFGFSSATLASGEVALGLGLDSHIRVLRVDVNGDVTEPMAPQIDSGSLNLPVGGRVAALAGGGFVVTWDEVAPARGRVIHMRLFDSAFRPRSAELLVPGLEEAYGAVPSPLPDGGFVMMWDGGAVGVQRFGPDGAPVGARTLLDAAWLATPALTCFKPIPVSCPPTQASVSLLTTSDGGWIAFWSNADGHGTPTGTYAKRFAADGTAAAAAVKLDMALPNARFYPMPISAAAPEGAFVLTWNTSRLDIGTGLNASSTWLQFFGSGAFR